MTLSASLHSRSDAKCELCAALDQLRSFAITPYSDELADHNVLICQQCHERLSESLILDPNHWHCLSDSMWSQVPAVQVIIWRLLNRLGSEPWAQDLLDMLYLEDDTLTWAKTNTNEDSFPAFEHKDSNGVSLQNGDTVTLTKDLNVKGVSFTAKRGTAVRNISLVTDNSEQLEGRVNGTQIVILTKFVKRAN